jgi:hypothetical protein
MFPLVSGEARVFIVNSTQPELAAATREKEAPIPTPLVARKKQFA